MLQKTLHSISEKNIRHAKSLIKYVESWDAEFRATAESFLDSYFKFLDSRGIGFDFAVDAYLFLVEEMVAHHLEFVRTGAYRYATFEEVNRCVYADSAYMQKYMVGLAISQFFWENHYAIFNFFRESIAATGNGTAYLEIGPGHGLFLLEALKATEYKKYTALDVSAESLALTREMIRHVRPDLCDKISFLHEDIDRHAMGSSYDFITMGEVLEHLENPEKVLQKIHASLKEGGRFFISTCANSPAVDHIYLFNDIDEITDMFARCGFRIEREAVLPISGYSLEKALARKITINYCALLSTQ